jgi:arylsulfatase A-like enzyme
MDLLRGQRADPRHVWFIEHHFPDGGWIPSSEGIRTGRWKYIRYTDDAAPFEEIYDLQQDRFETRNLAGKAEHANEQRLLRSYCDRWRDSLHDKTVDWTEPVTQSDLARDGLA